MVLNGTGRAGGVSAGSISTILRLIFWFMSSRTLMFTLTEFCNDRRKRDTVNKELIQLGVHPSVHVAEVFPSPRTARFVHRIGLTLGLTFDLRT